MVSPGGVGKTAIEVVFALMMATGRMLVPNITVWGTWKVLLLMLDDDDDEADRRVQAAMKYHGIGEEEVGGRFVYYTVSRDKLVVRDPQHPEILGPGPLLQSLERTIVEDGFDAVLIDPLINVANVKENSNEEMNYLIDQVAGLAQRLDIGVHVNHHTRKGGGEPGDQDKARGAGAFVNRGRLFYDLNPMSEDDARLYDVPLRERRRYLSLVRSKDNLTVGDEERWFKLEGQDLGNATDLYPAGDNVQTIIGWKAPDAFEGLSTGLIDEIVDKLEVGPEPGRRYSGQAQATKRGAWKVVVQVTGKPEPQAKSIIAAWIRSGFLIDDEYTYTRSDGKGTRTESGLRVRPGPRPGRAI
jgi:AAA domain